MRAAPSQPARRAPSSKDACCLLNGTTRQYPGAAR
ncbi:hypothetical protein A2U01_0054947, partial [Trifolium medium]|nr:hypothetical protein [Trifolium medium]